MFASSGDITARWGVPTLVLAQRPSSLTLARKVRTNTSSTRRSATAVDTDGYPARCMTYIDMNMVRAGVVGHPKELPASGYGEIQQPPQRYRIIDQPALLALFGTPSLEVFQQAHRQWAEQALAENNSARDPRWSQALAAGSERFVRQFQKDMGIVGSYREISQHGDGYRLGEREASYSGDFEGEMVALRVKNSVFLG